MTKKEIVICECGCERCSHKWMARRKETPVVCPHCKSPYWDKPMRKKRKRK